ncbi:MAG TPA: hypothetical protein VIZ65_00310 [Cellvibrionaceae bacterium]
MAASRIERILILAKTYPSPSAQYVETSCVAGINKDGLMRRLFPVPFRLIQDSQQFRKWQWVDVRIEKAPKDHRLESHKLYVDTISCGDVVDTKREWATRLQWLDRIPTFTNFDKLNSAQEENGLSLALLRPKRLVRLEITKARSDDWTDDERQKLMQEQMQGSLFDEIEERKQLNQLRKIPFDFYYVYACDTPDGEKEYRHKIVDWEAGALFWNCRRMYGEGWEIPFRAKLEAEFGDKDLMLLMGNQHRFQNQWLIISLIYPPKRKLAQVTQTSLF